MMYYEVDAPTRSWLSNGPAAGSLKLSRFSAASLTCLPSNPPTDSTDTLFSYDPQNFPSSSSGSQAHLGEDENENWVFVWCQSDLFFTE
jgi:hypothetical protein